MIYFKNYSITWEDASLIWSTDDEVIYSEFYQDTDVTWADDDIFWNQIEVKAPNDYYRDGDTDWVNDDTNWITSELLNYFKDATDTWENDDDEWYETVPTTGTVQTPIISPSAGEYPANSEYIVITCGTFGSTIYYTDDGTTPDKTSLVYTKEILLGKDVTIKVIGIKTEYTDSSIASSIFTVSAQPQVDTPVIAPTSGEYLTSQLITITCGTSGATIYYTEDGSIPDATDIEYTAPFTLGSAKTIKARGIKATYIDSEIVSETYTIGAGVSIQPMIFIIT